MYNEKTNATREYGLIVEVTDGDEIASLADLASISLRISYLIIDTKEPVDLSPLAKRQITSLRMNRRAKIPVIPDLRHVVCAEGLTIDDVRDVPALESLEFSLATTTDAPAEMINISILRKTLPDLKKLFVGLPFERLLTHYNQLIELVMGSDGILRITDEIYEKLGLTKSTPNEMYLNYLIDRAVIQLNSDKFIARRGMASEPFIQLTTIAP